MPRKDLSLLTSVGGSQFLIASTFVIPGLIPLRVAGNIEVVTHFFLIKAFIENYYFN